MCNIRVNWALVCIHFLSLSSFASVSVIAPFFPSEAAKKGISPSLAGGVFSIFGVFLILTNTITGKLLPRAGSRVILTTGAVTVGIANITFGLLNNINHSNTFIALCFIVRAIEGIGAAFVNTTAYMILIKKSGDNLNKAVASYNACISIGFTIGPPLGSLLYSFGGYKLPFVVFGSAVLVNVPLSFILIENITCMYKELNMNYANICALGSAVTDHENFNDRKLTYIRLLSVPKIIVVCLAILVISTNYGVFHSTLEPYLEFYNIGQKYVGYIFMIMSASFAVSSMIVGRFFAQYNGFKLLVFSFCLNTIAFIVIGPSPFFVLRGNLPLVVFALLIIGVGSAFTYVPSMPTILSITAKNGYPNNVTNSSYASGVWTTVDSLGRTIGPYFGALLFQHFGYGTLFTVIASINLTCSFISLQALLKYCNTSAPARGDGYENIH